MPAQEGSPKGSILANKAQKKAPQSNVEEPLLKL